MQPVIILRPQEVAPFMRGFSEVTEISRETHIGLYVYDIVYKHSCFSAQLVVKHSVSPSHDYIWRWEVIPSSPIGVYLGSRVIDITECLTDAQLLSRYRRHFLPSFTFRSPALNVLNRRFESWPGKFKTALKKSESFGYSFRELIQNFHNDAFFTAFMSPMVKTREDLDKVLNPANSKSLKPLRCI